MNMSMPNSVTKALDQPPVELADIFTAHQSDYHSRYSVPVSHLKVMRAIEICRTDTLGGHTDKCDHCGFKRIWYNSCRNRHCPKCQSMAKAQWLQSRKAELLPVSYFHNVFTLPHLINPIARCNKKIVYDMLFHSVAYTLKLFGVDPKHGLNGELGFTAILHTWDQKLFDHIHLHCVIPGGALTKDGQWRHAKKDYLFPVKALSKVFRGRFMELFKQANSENTLRFEGKSKVFASQKTFDQLVNQLWQKDWVVYSKKPFLGPEKVLDYLGRYTHRVAISNHRIKSMDHGQVAFTYRDRRDGNKTKAVTLEAHEFMRRFLLHVLPHTYMRIRHYGFLASKCKKDKLIKCRQALNCSPQQAEPPIKRNAQAMLLHLTGKDLNKCPVCGKGSMCHSEEISRLPIHTWYISHGRGHWP